KAGLDHVHPQSRELVCDLELFLLVQGDPRGLLAVAQRRVEDQDAVRVVAFTGGCATVGGAPSLSRFLFLSAGGGVARAPRPPRAMPPEGGAGEERQARVRTTSAAARSTGRPERQAMPATRLRGRRS